MHLHHSEIIFFCLHHLSNVIYANIFTYSNLAEIPTAQTPSNSTVDPPESTGNLVFENIICLHGQLWKIGKEGGRARDELKTALNP